MTADETTADQNTAEEPIVLTDTRDLFSGLDAGFLHRNWSVIDVYGRLARIQSVRVEVEERLRGASSAGSAA